jgi:hypothetical protein
MALAIPHVFVSATTHDLGSYRKVVTEELQTGKLHPVVQEYFGPDARKLRDYLRSQISECDAVICLVGFTMAAALAATRASPDPIRSLSTTSPSN